MSSSLNGVTSIFLVKISTKNIDRLRMMLNTPPNEWKEMTIEDCLFLCTLFLVPVLEGEAINCLYNDNIQKAKMRYRAQRDLSWEKIQIILLDLIGNWERIPTHFSIHYLDTIWIRKAEIQFVIWIQSLTSTSTSWNWLRIFKVEMQLSLKALSSCPKMLIICTLIMQWRVQYILLC